jgi:hypothetical protein
VSEVPCRELTARMVTKINSSLRTFTYPAPLAQAP